MTLRPTALITVSMSGSDYDQAAVQWCRGKESSKAGLTFVCRHHVFIFSNVPGDDLGALISPLLQELFLVIDCRWRTENDYSLERRSLAILFGQDGSGNVLSDDSGTSKDENAWGLRHGSV